MRAFWAFLLVTACGTPSAPKTDAGPDVAAAPDSSMDAPAIGAPCSPDPSMIPTACGSGWCASPGGDAGYTCNARCPAVGGCPSGTTRVLIEGGQCECEPK